MFTPNNILKILLTASESLDVNFVNSQEPAVSTYARRGKLMFLLLQVVCYIHVHGQSKFRY